MDLSINALTSGAALAASSVGGAVQAAAATAASALPSAPAVVNAGVANAGHVATSLAMVEKPVRGLAAGIGSSGFLARTAAVLGKALPIAAIGTSAFTGAKLVQDFGPSTLLETKKGRGAVLGAVGGGLILVPAPPAQLLAAGVFGTAMANELGAFATLDEPLPPKRRPGTPWF